MERFKERLAIALAWLLPRRLAYWAFIRVSTHASTGQWGYESPAELPLTKIAARWDIPHARLEDAARLT